MSILRTKNAQLEKANEFLKAALAQTDKPNDVPDTIRIENRLSDVKRAIEEDIQSGEKLIEHYQDLGQTVGASGPSQVEQDKQAARKAEKAALIELGLNHYAENETRARLMREDKNRNYHNYQDEIAIRNQESDDNQYRQMQSEESRRMIDNAAREQQITAENKAKRNALEEEQKNQGQPSANAQSNQPSVSSALGPFKGDVRATHLEILKSVLETSQDPNKSQQQQVAEIIGQLNSRYFEYISDAALKSHGVISDSDYDQAVARYKKDAKASIDTSNQISEKISSVHQRTKKKDDTHLREESKTKKTKRSAVLAS